jgi:hypothetical protein
MAGTGYFDTPKTAAVSGTVTANAGTDLNTSALATQATLAQVKAKTDNLPSDPAKESGKLTDIANALDAPATGTPTYITLAANVSNETAGDVAAGEYLIKCTADFCFRLNAGGGAGAAAVWVTSPAIWMKAGDSYWHNAAAAFRVAAIAQEAAYVCVIPVPPS